MNWIPVNTPNKKEIDSLAKQLSVDLLISKILIQRGVNTFDKAKKFFRPKLDDLYDPFLMKDMDIAVDRIQKAISKKEKIVSENGKCSWVEVECLGACVNSPMIQVNENYYEDLNEKDMKNIIDSFMNDKPLKPGSYRGRKNSAPENNKILGEGHA